MGTVGLMKSTRKLKLYLGFFSIFSLPHLNLLQCLEICQGQSQGQELDKKRTTAFFLDSTTNFPASSNKFSAIYMYRTGLGIISVRSPGNKVRITLYLYGRG